MRAVGYRQSQPIAAETSLIDLDLPEPKAAGRDLLVEVQAVSVNPVDTKIRVRSQPAEGQTSVLGWDAARIARGPSLHSRRNEDYAMRHASDPASQAHWGMERCGSS